MYYLEFFESWESLIQINRVMGYGVCFIPQVCVSEMVYMVANNLKRFPLQGGPTLGANKNALSYIFIPYSLCENRF